jgi:hypothetical protein
MTRFSLLPETIDAIIEQEQTSYYVLTDGENLQAEKKTLELVLNGQPSGYLRQRTETRLADIARQLEETNMTRVNYEDLFDLIPCLNLKKHISFLPQDEPIVHMLEKIKDTPAQYPADLLKARRADFEKRLAAFERSQSVPS